MAPQVFVMQMAKSHCARMGETRGIRHEVQPIGSCSVTGINDISVLVVHSYADSETVAQPDQMASNTASDVDH